MSELIKAYRVDKKGNPVDRNGHILSNPEPRDFHRISFERILKHPEAAGLWKVVEGEVKPKKRK